MFSSLDPDMDLIENVCPNSSTSQAVLRLSEGANSSADKQSVEMVASRVLVLIEFEAMAENDGLLPPTGTDGAPSTMAETTLNKGCACRERISP